DKDLQVIQDLETKLGVDRCLDDLEGLIISWMFELTKMNMSRTGVSSASATSPPQPNLSWNDVVEYAFLADFDLLWENRQDVRDCPWTKPAFCVVIDQYYKLEHACKEIQHLNIEIPRLITYIQDEDRFLCSKVAEVMEVNSGLAWQVEKHRLQWGRFDDQHMR
ncbi:hypothetical protein L208DRAFT_1281425, partial [Tricholoma matsutake]